MEKGSLKDGGYQYTTGAPLRFVDFSGAKLAKKMASVRVGVGEEIRACV